MIIFTLNSRFRRLFLIVYWELVYIYVTERKLFLKSKKKKFEKLIGHHTRLQENDDLPLWRAPAIKKRPPFFNVRALITREIMPLFACVSERE